MRRVHEVILAVAIAAAAAACGGSKMPASPSAAGSVVPGGSAGPSAIVTGAVQGAGASALTAASSGPAITGVTITVVGTSISATVDGGGRFALMNVPTGNIQLQLSGGGANATVTLASVQAAQTVDVVVAVAGSTASLESEVRSGAGEAQLEGRVESLPPTTAALTFKAAGRTVRTDSATRFIDGSQARAFADLRLGMRVHARGTLTGDTFTATTVEMQNSNAAIEAEVNGVIDTLTGSASAFQFKIGSRLIKGDNQTSFVGDSNTAGSFASLKNGVRVEVKGEQRDDFIQATRIHVEDDANDDHDDDNGQTQSASVQGLLNAKTGTSPNFVLTVGTTSVRTTSATVLKRKGDVLPLTALQTGQSLHVEGTRQTNGSIDARKIEIEDDNEDEAEFETEGALSGLAGTCPAIRFTVNSAPVTTSSTTRFDDVSCTALANGNRVEVKGLRQSTGTVIATRIKKK